MGALLLGACAPQFPGTGAVQQHSGSDCKVVLVVGDSIANEMAPYLQGRLAASGRCATVVNRAYNGSSSGDWVPAIAGYLDDVQPDIVLIELVGNEGTAGPVWSDPAWLGSSANNAVLITDAALSRGVQVYWAVPPVGAYYCMWQAPNVALWPQWAWWVRAYLPNTRPVGIADWRTPFGGEVYTPQFLFPDGSVRTLRQPDCLHLTPAGATVAADATVYAIQHEWGAAAAAVPEPPVPVPVADDPDAPDQAPVTVPEVTLPPVSIPVVTAPTIPLSLG